MRTPVFSIVVPTYDRWPQVHVLLEALQRLDFAKDDFEVIVVNDSGSCDPESVRSQCAGLNLRLLTQEHAGPASARNRGAACAAGRYLAFADDDCVPDRNWLNEFQAKLCSYPEHLIGGRTLNAASDNLYACATQWISDRLHGHFNRDEQNARFFPSNNIAMSAGLFQSVGGFRHAFPFAGGEDREFCDRWLRRGFGMAYAPGAIVRHDHRMTLGGYLRRHFRYGRGARILRRVAGEGGGRVPFEPFTFYRQMLTRPFGQTEHAGCALVAAISQCAVASGYLWEATLARRFREAMPGAAPQVPRGIQETMEE